MSQMFFHHRQVLSGDSLVVRGVPQGGPPPEQLLFFSSVQAPRLARAAGRNGEAETEDEVGQDFTIK